MTPDSAAAAPASHGSDRVLQALLAPLLGDRTITGIDRRLSPFRSSVLVEEIDVSLDDGTTMALAAKAVDWRALDPDARRAKPRHLWNDRRELAAYASVLSAADVGTPRFFGAFADSAGVRYLLLERIDGTPLWQFGEFEAWRAAARWLARMHCRIDAQWVAAHAAAAPLLRYDRAYYESWLARALTFAAGSEAALRSLAVPHDAVVAHLLAQPAAFIHGEFYSANILVRRGGDGYVVRPLDWEMAALGPALVDLACLASGRWTDDQRADLADAYHDELRARGVEPPPRSDYLRTLEAALIHLSVQNLGWSDTWAPPPDRVHDWLGEALRLGERWR